MLRISEDEQCAPKAGVGRAALGERPHHLGRLLGAPRLTELVRYSAVPSAKLAQKAPTPASAGRTSTLLEESEVEEQDGQRGDEKRRKPELHDVPFSRGRRRPSTGASYFGRTTRSTACIPCSR